MSRILIIKAETEYKPKRKTNQKETNRKQIKEDVLMAETTEKYPIPEIRKDGRISTLYVKGEPFFALSGEIHNSSASSLDYMEEHVWKQVEDMHLNSLIVPLYWETIEPEEGQYDFTLPDGLIRQARKHKMHLIFLWFGLWKNAESFYVPGWMKRDSEKYWRVQTALGETINTISPLCRDAVEKDAKAFAAVMAHIREVDADESTVIVMQVENEIGLLNTACDYSPRAREAFAKEIPEEMAKLYGARGDWKSAFGDDAEEYFMAYHFAKAVEQITDAGRKEYPLPCYANAWLRQYPWYAGSYPSGGPVCEVHKIWKMAAPALFTLAPDIYVPYVANVMDEYSYDGNPLFVPEVRKDAVTASYALYAFGKHNAICYSPFGIEDLALPQEAIDRPPMEVMAALNIDPSAFEIRGSKEYLGRVYQLIDEMKPLYMKYRGSEHLKAYVRKSDTDFGTYFRFKNYDVSVAYAPKMPEKPLAAGMIYELSEDQFLIVGMRSTFTFRAKESDGKKVNYVKVQEGEIKNGEWLPGRILNGDEQMSLKCGDMAECLYVELYKY